MVVTFLLVGVVGSLVLGLGGAEGGQGPPGETDSLDEEGGKCPPGASASLNGGGKGPPGGLGSPGKASVKSIFSKSENRLGGFEEPADGGFEEPAECREGGFTYNLKVLTTFLKV